MMNLKVISTRDDFSSFLQALDTSEAWIYPVFSDPNKPKAVNRPSVLIAFIGNNAYLVAYHHNEAPHLPIETLSQIKGKLVVVPDTKDWLYLGRSSNDNVYDTQMHEYLMFGKTSEWAIPSICTDMRNRYRNHHNVNDAIPIMKLLEEAEAWKEHANRYLAGTEVNKTPDFYSILPKVLHFMESPGLKVDEEEFAKHFGEKSKVYDGFVYSQYHPYHVTGRPSNSFGDINFAAIPKKDGSRKSFVSRFDKEGKLVLIDFESFHLRLIAELIGWKQPTEPFHEYLAKQYYGKSAISKDEYEEGKRITFRNLYSEVEEARQIQFFDEVYKWSDNLWEATQKNGYLQMYHKERRVPLSLIDLPTKSKVFNYFIQGMESVVAISQINKLRAMYTQRRSRVVLYTYDSILIDYCRDDGPDLIQDTIDLLEHYEGTTFPTRMYAGDNYHDMKKLGK